MFLLNLGYRWTLATAVEAVTGVVFLPCGNNLERLMRSPPPEFHRLLLDPQLYLARLDAEHCAKTCARLATYPWFGVQHLPEYDSATMKRREWERWLLENIPQLWPGSVPSGAAVGRAAASAIEFQLSMGCTHVILPTPLIDEREDEADAAGCWLDEGLAAAAEFDVAQPILATVAIQDSVLNDGAFEPGGFLDTVADQVAARAEIDGVYIVVAQSAVPTHPFTAPSPVLRAYLHLVRAFQTTGKDPIVVNFADVFGLVSMAAGATTFATGPSQSLRRLSLAGFRDGGGGKALPHYYSHRTIAEYLTEEDLDKISASRLTRRIADETPFSAPLVNALRSGVSAGTLPAWAESENNIQAAQKHFIHRLCVEGQRMASLTGDERAEVARGWLEDAEANALFMQERLGKFKGRRAPSAQWLDLFDSTE